MNLAKGMGILVGVLVGLGLVLLTTKLCNKNRKFKTEYDERQKIIRGNGYKYGFWTVFIYAILNCLLGFADISLPLEPAVLAFSYAILGGIVDIVYCIWNDAYFGLNNNANKYLIAFVIIAVINLISPVSSFINGTFFVNGAASTPALNLMCSIMFFVIFITLFVKKIYDRKVGA